MIHPLTRIGSMQANSGQQIDTLGMLTRKVKSWIRNAISGNETRFRQAAPDCAIRCIAGGISPVLWIRTNGVSNYCLLVGTDGKH